MNSIVKINILPIEMMLKLFSLLSPKDLKMVVLVCKMWRDLGEDPQLWTWTKVRICSREDIKKLYIKRLQHKLSELEELSVSGWLTYPWMSRYNCPGERMYPFVTKNQYNCLDGELEELFKAFDKLPKLKYIDGLFNVNLSSVEPELLARVFTRLELVDLGNNSLTSKQVQALFEAMAQNTQLKGLHFSFDNLSAIKPEVMTSVVTKLEQVFMCFDNLNAEQLASILDHVTQEDTKLWKLWLLRNDSDDLDLEIVSKAREKLGKVLRINAGPEGMYDILLPRSCLNVNGRCSKHGANAW